LRDGVEWIWLVDDRARIDAAAWRQVPAPRNPASPSANAGCEVTMLVVSMNVPLVLSSTAIGCGLEVQAVAFTLCDVRCISVMSPLSSVGRAAF
jgi:hypothetical protein